MGFAPNSSGHSEARRSLRPTWTPPEQFDDYRVIRPLGIGAMGQVFLAHDRVLDREVAIKFVSSVDSGGSARERFLTEARAAARLQHPNVVAVHRVGEIDDRPYIISEFVSGSSLDKVEKPMPAERALELGIGLARGLAAAHRRGVLHRDIKPGNAILAEDGHVKLVDFGLAKLIDQALIGVASSDIAKAPEPPVAALPAGPAAAAGFVSMSL